MFYFSHDSSQIDGFDVSTASQLTIERGSAGIDVYFEPELSNGLHEIRCTVTNEFQKTTRFQRVFEVSNSLCAEFERPIILSTHDERFIIGSFIQNIIARGIGGVDEFLHNRGIRSGISDFIERFPADEDRLVLLDVSSESSDLSHYSSLFLGIPSMGGRAASTSSGDSSRRCFVFGGLGLLRHGSQAEVGVAA